jgi:NIPSNAP
MSAPLSVIELRQYTLKPGARDTLIELFEREFVESQEECGCEVIGQFRDLGDADRFVWLRGFADMPSRAKALAAFYGGPVWKAHREAANVTMVDSDNVLLLRPARPQWGFGPNGAARPPVGATKRPDNVLCATICLLDGPADETLLTAFEAELSPALAEAGARVVACLVTEHSPNNFPALPVREGVNAFIWFCREIIKPIELPNAVTARLVEAPAVLRLSSTARSKLQV